MNFKKFGCIKTSFVRVVSVLLVMGGGQGCALRIFTAPKKIVSSITQPDLSAVAQNGAVLLVWEAQPTATQGYVIERRLTSGGGAFTPIGSTHASGISAYTDFSVTPGTSYTYQVKPQGSGTGDTTQVAVVAPLDLSHAGSVAVSDYSYRFICTTKAGTGEVHCAGNNATSVGTFGDGSTTDSTTFTSNGLTQVRDLGTSQSGTTCALTSTDDLWCWGQNAQGQLGDGSTTDASVPVQSSINDVQSMEMMAQTTCVLKKNGRVWCVGNNANGEFGDGTSGVQSTLWQEVPLLSGIRAISASGSNVCALDSLDQLYCWGANDYGQLGDGTTVPSLIPVRVSTSLGVSQVSVGSGYVCSVYTDQTLWCWGNGASGQIGQGGGVSANVPVQVSGVNQVSALSVGLNGVTFVKNFTEIYQLGQSNIGGLSTPTLRFTVNQADKIVGRGNGTVCAIDTGVLRCCGDNSMGELGLGDTQPRELPGLDLVWVTQELSPATQLVGTAGAGAVKLSWNPGKGARTGYDVRRRLTSDPDVPGSYQIVSSPQKHFFNQFTDVGVTPGTSYTYKVRAKNGSSESADSNLVAVTPLSGTNGVKASGKGNTLCAIDKNLDLSCWGDGSQGQLGDGLSTSSVSTPVVVASGDWVDVSAGGSWVCGVKKDGTVHCWGTGPSGTSLGGVTRQTPTAVTAISTATQVAVGSSHACALLAQGDVYCWGGQGGVSWDIPRKIEGMSNIVQIGAGIFTCARDGAGAVSCFESSRSMDPISIPLPAPAVDIAVDSGTLCAVLNTGEVYCSGVGGSGQLGNGTTGSTDIDSPYLVNGISTATKVTIGQSGVCARLLGGGSKCWGYNSGGLGSTPTVTTSSTPIPTDFTQADEVWSTGTAICGLRGGGVQCVSAQDDYGILGTGQNLAINWPTAVPRTAVALASPSVPNGVTATGGSGLITITWNNVGGADQGYQVSRRLSAAPDVDGSYAVIAQLPKSDLTGFNDYSVVSGTGYHYRVRAVGSLGTSAYSTAVGATATVFVATAAMFGTGGTQEFGSWCAQHPSGRIECLGNNGSGELGTAKVNIPVTNTAESLGVVTATHADATRTVVSGPMGTRCVLNVSGQLRCAGTIAASGFIPGSWTLNAVNTGGILFAGATLSFESNGRRFCGFDLTGKPYCAGQTYLGDLAGSGGASLVEVYGLHGLKEVSGGEYFTCGLTVLGRVYCWGRINGSLEWSYPTPQSIPETVKSIKAGKDFICAQSQNNDLYCTSSSWAKVSAFSQDVKHFAVGADSVCVVKTDESLWCWGDNTYQQTSNPGSTPAQVGFKSWGSTYGLYAAASGYCALSNDDPLFLRSHCWGANGNSQLGNLNYIAQQTPVNEIFNIPLVAPDAPTSFTIGVSTFKNSHKLSWAHPDGVFPTLGYDVQRRLATDPDVDGSYGTVCDNGEASAWGCEDSFLSWSDANAAYVYRVRSRNPVGVSAWVYSATTATPRVLRVAPKIVSANYHTCLLKSDRTLWCWGGNGSGQARGGMAARVTVPTQVASQVDDVAVFDATTCYVSAGNAHCFGGWGMISHFDGVIRNTGKVSRVTLDGGTFCVIEQGVPFCRGNNRGDLSPFNSNTTSFTKVYQLSGVSEIQAMSLFTCALGKDYPWCWGYDNRTWGGASGGFGEFFAKAIPINMAKVYRDGISSLIGGVFDTLCLITQSGNFDGFECSGAETMTGTLGDGGPARNYFGPPAMGGGRIVSMSVGMNAQHICGVGDNGQIYCWGGDNAEGVIGRNGGGGIEPIPKNIPGVTNAIAVSAGSGFSCAVSDDNGNEVVHCWGKNDQSQLGDGTTTASREAVRAL